MFQSIQTTFSGEAPLENASWMEPTPSVPSSRAQQFLGTWRAADSIIGERIFADVTVAFQVEQERSVVDSAGNFTLRFGRKKFRAGTFVLHL